jgi:hypothetical protein
VVKAILTPTFFLALGWGMHSWRDHIVGDASPVHGKQKGDRFLSTTPDQNQGKTKEKLGHQPPPLTTHEVTVIEDGESPAPVREVSQEKPMRERSDEIKGCSTWIGDVMPVRDASGFQALIQLSSTDRISSALQKHLSIRQHDLPESISVRTLATRLMEVAVEHHARVETSPDEEVVEPILFSSSVNNDSSPIEAAERFYKSDCRIYGCFRTTQEMAEEKKVLVKWYRESDGEVLLMEYMPITPNNPWNHVWVRQQKGWTPDEYRLRVFTLEDNVRCLADGSFEVLPTGEGFSTSSIEFASPSNPSDFQTAFMLGTGDVVACIRYVASSDPSLHCDYLVGGQLLKREHLSAPSEEGILQVSLSDAGIDWRLHAGQMLLLHLYSNGALLETGKILVAP